MGIKTISDLNSLTKTTLSEKDLILITDISAKETKNIEVSEYQDYTISKLDYLHTGSFTGSFFGYLTGNSATSLVSTHSNLAQTSEKLLFTGENNGTASYSISSSNNNLSISSSQSNSSSYTLSSSYVNETLFSFNTSSTHALHSIRSLKSDKSEISLVSLGLNYFGQNNGTAHSSSVSERCNYTSIAHIILDQTSSTVLNTFRSDRSMFSDKSGNAITASLSKNSKIASSALSRLFSSVEFRVTTDVFTKKLNITPISWKNIQNIAAGSIGKFYTDFYINYKNRPNFPVDKQMLASYLSTAVVCSFQLQTSNIVPDVNSHKFPVPIFTSFIFSCGVDGYVIRFVNCTLYGAKQKRTFWGHINNVFGFALGLGLFPHDHRRQTAVHNNFGAFYWDKQLEGVIISAQTFCNTLNFLELGPPYTHISQVNSSLFNNSMYKTPTLNKSNVYSHFPPNSVILNTVFKWEAENYVEVDVTYNRITSIAHASESSYNLLLLERSDKYSGAQIALVDNDTFYNASMHFPKTGSSINDAVPNVKYLYYNTRSYQYLAVSNTKLLYITSSTIHNYTGSNTEENDLYSPTVNSSLPIWNEYKSNSATSLWTRVAHINDNRYIVVDSSSYQLMGNDDTSSKNMPIYIIPNITSQATSSITSKNVTSSMMKTTNIKLGYSKKDDPELGVRKIDTSKTSTNIYAGTYRDVVISDTSFKCVCVVNTASAIVAGTNGVIVYSNTINTNTPTWIRIDPLSPAFPSGSLYLQSTTEYLTAINDLYLTTVDNDDTRKVIVVIGQDTCGRSSMIMSEIPQSNESTITNWKWGIDESLFNILPRRTSNDGKLVPSDVGDSCFNVCFKDKNVIIAGYNTFPSGSFYRYGLDRKIPISYGEHDSKSVINAIGKINDQMYIFGGENLLDVYKIS